MNMTENLKVKYRDKRVLIVGLGLQGGGVGTARFFAELGAIVTVTDLKSAEELAPSIRALAPYDVSYRLGGHLTEDFVKADVIFKGPSIKWDMPEIVEALNHGIPVEMETAFFAANTKGIVIGITGTRGKSTTTQMIYEVLKQRDKKIYLAGNIPNTSTIELLNKVNQGDLAVLELSSWQLSGFHRKKISPHIAVFTNFYPDHLNYYSSMEEYLYDKKAIYLYQKPEDYLVINKSIEALIKDDQIKSQTLSFSAADFPDNLFHPRGVRGVHNQENAAAALTTVKISGADHLQAIDIIKNFSGLPYRQQLIKTIGNVIFINDTTSTTPTAAIKAVETFSNKPIVLIAGGNSKGLPINQLIESLNSVKRIILLKGTMTDKMFPILKEKYPDKISIVFDDLEAAVSEAYKQTKDLAECYILFSPGATSFAMFKNEFHRGEEFNRIVNSM